MKSCLKRPSLTSGACQELVEQVKTLTSGACEKLLEKADLNIRSVWRFIWESQERKWIACWNAGERTSLASLIPSQPPQPPPQPNPNYAGPLVQNETSYQYAQKRCEPARNRSRSLNNHRVEIALQNPPNQKSARIQGTNSTNNTNNTTNTNNTNNTNNQNNKNHNHNRNHNNKHNHM